MKIKNYAVLLLISFILISACKKTDRGLKAPEINLSVADKTINAGINQTITIEASDKNTATRNKPTFDQEWQLNGVVVSNTSVFSYKIPKSGTYLVIYKASNEGGAFIREYTIHVDPVVVPTTANSNAYVTNFFEFSPAAGQFVNKAPGDEASAKGLLGKKGLVSLGAFGGYVVYGFDHTVINQANADDLMIYGNAFAGFSEPGVVWVMQDENGNGKPDDTWYELAGSEFGKPGYVRNYSVTYYRPVAPTLSVSWKDNNGLTGVVKQSFHKQAHYPLWITADQFTLTGTLLPSTGITGASRSNELGTGYADNKPGGDRMDIANAIDKDGKKVSLQGIDFIKVQTGIMADLTVFGELSTEVSGIADLSLIK